MKTPSCRRLADSSIWIAFDDIGCLEHLLAVPGIAVAKPVAGELKGDLARRVKKRLQDDCFDVEMGADSLTATLAEILQASDRRLSQQDAIQVAYAHYAHSQGRPTILYMRDGPAERQAAHIGAPVRNHLRLVDDMLELRVISESEAQELRRKLAAYFPGPGERRRII